MNGLYWSFFLMVFPHLSFDYQSNQNLCYFSFTELNILQWYTLFSYSNNISVHLQPCFGYQVGLCPAHCACLWEPLAAHVSEHFPQQQVNWQSVAHLVGMITCVSVSSHQLVQQLGEDHQLSANPGTFSHHSEGISWILLWVSAVWACCSHYLPA